jgi:hypothetical protein
MFHGRGLFFASHKNFKSEVIHKNVSMKPLHKINIEIQLQQDSRWVTVYAEGRAIVRLERDMRSITNYDPMVDTELLALISLALDLQIVSITRHDSGNGGAN